MRYLALLVLGLLSVEGRAVMANPPMMASGPADPVSGIVFTGVDIERLSVLPGVSAVADADLHAVAASYLDRPVTLDDLRQLGTDMEGVFQNAGYPYIRVVLPPQEMVGGRVRFQVIEGWVEGVVVLGTSDTAKAQAEVQLATLAGRGPIALGDIESTIARLDRIPGLISRVSIARGDQGPGAMRIIAEATRQDAQVLLNVQNLGSKSIGREGTTLFVGVPGWATYGDELAMALFGTWEANEQVSGQLSYTRGLTAEGLTVAIRGAYSEAEPSGAVATFGSTSDSVTGGLEFEQPVYLTGDDLLSAYLGVEFGDLNGELFQGAVPLSEDKTRVLYAGVQGEFVWDEWTVSGLVEGRQGLTFFDASREGDASLARAEADPQARLARGEVVVTAPRIWGVEVEVEFQGQLATEPLMAIEEFTFGNYGIGRGYDPGAAAGDSAIGVGLTLSGFRQQFWGDALGGELIAFYDIGRYWNEDTTGVASRTIASVGVGVRFVLSDVLSADITYAHPLDQPVGAGESRPGGRVLFSVTTDGRAFWNRLADLGGE